VLWQVSSETSYEKFLEEFPENDGRYAFYDLEYDSSDGRKTDKLIFISW
jgi:cofilin